MTISSSSLKKLIYANVHEDHQMWRMVFDPCTPALLLIFYSNADANGTFC